ncbi:hypothetical protein [Pedobacter sp.]|uniref:hypothetical protein n=1 Tax=Pedobacter sp. TaxID=1411316 RepID=UPI003D7FFE45
MKLKIVIQVISLLIYAGAQAQTDYMVGASKVSIEPAQSAFSLALAGYGVPREGRFTLEWVDKGAANNSNPLWRQISRSRSPAASVNNFKLDKALLPGGLLNLAIHQKQIYALTDGNALLKYQPAKQQKWLSIARYNGLTYNQDIREVVIAKGMLYGIGKDNRVYMAVHSSNEDLSVSALAIKADQKTVVIMGMDVCGINSSFIEPIKQHIYKTFKIPPSAILINASHTHFAPVSQDWSTWGEPMQYPDSIYLNTVIKEAIVKAVKTALKNMKRSSIQFGRGKTNIGMNRSLTGADALYDNDVDVLVANHTKGGSKDLIFLTGCHPVFDNSGKEGVTISANYPGVVRRHLFDEAGIANALFLQGCGGDINPKQNSYVKTGDSLALDVLNILNSPMKRIEGAISYRLDTLRVPVKSMPVQNIRDFKADNSNQPGNVYAEKNVRWADLMLNYVAENKMPQVMPVYIQTINIGNWKLVGLSREAVTAYSIGIKGLWPDQLVSVAGYCNDVSSYLPTRAHIKAQGYEGLDSFYWYGQPAVFPENIYEQIVDRIKEKNY